LQVNGTASFAGAVTAGSGSNTVEITPSSVGRVNIKKEAGSDAYIELAGNGNTAGTSSLVIGQSGADLGVIYNRKNAALSFGTNGTERLSISASGAATFAGTAIFGKAGSNTTFSANGTTAESGIYTQPNTGFVFFADNASATKGIKVDVNNGGLTVLSGGLTTATAGGSAGTWKLGVYSATAPSATGYVTIDIGGTTYKLLAST